MKWSSWFERPRPLPRWYLHCNSSSDYPYCFQKECRSCHQACSSRDSKGHQPTSHSPDPSILRGIPTKGIDSLFLGGWIIFKDNVGTIECLLKMPQSSQSSGIALITTLDFYLLSFFLHTRAMLWYFYRKIRWFSFPLIWLTDFLLWKGK